MRRTGNQRDAKEMEALRKKVESSYDETTDIRHAASHLWVDGITNPQDTRNVLISALEAVTQRADDEPFRTGVLQVRKLLNPLATSLRLANASMSVPVEVNKWPLDASVDEADAVSSTSLALSNRCRTEKGLIYCNTY